MKVLIHINPADAVRAGRDQHGYHVVEVPAESLTEEQRAELARCPADREDTRAPFNASRPAYRGSSCPHDPTEATAAEVVACLEAWIAQKTAETAEKAEEARLATELTAAVLAERRVRHSEHSEFCHGCEDVDYTLLYAHWPHPHDDKIVSSEDAVAWEAELQAARVETRDAARKEADQRVKAIEEAKRARLA
ncbi:MAG: hypothetical protein ACYSWU_28750, partial [Planctomycetota bacterium]